jgi:hypothetical protein
VPRTLNPPKINTGRLRQVAAYGRERLIDRLGLQGWPATNGDDLGDLLDAHPLITGTRGLSSEEAGQRRCSGAVSHLREGHRAHRQAEDSPGAAVASGVFSSLRRTGEDEQPGAAAAVVDAPAYLVPDLRNDLPFVDEPWVVPVE